MFLIRLAFWLALIVLVLPTDPQQQERLATTAAQTMQRIATFCDRNSSACERGSAYWAVFKQKLEFGARLAYDMASAHVFGTAETPQATGAIGAPEPRAKGPKGGA